MIGAFEVLRRLGEGGLADVYLVRHNDTRTLHALKVMRVRRPDLSARLRREGRIQSGVRHPNLVAVTDVVEVEGESALVMEYVAGHTLAEELSRRGHLPVGEAVQITRQVLAAMDAAHRAGVLHRDLKPGNVLLTREGGRWHAKVTDFGLAKVFEESRRGTYPRTRVGAMLGTPGYMAPEQLAGSPHVGAAADIFSVGVILYEMLTGRRPFERADDFGTLAATRIGDHLPVGWVARDLPTNIVLAVERAIRVTPGERFLSCAAMEDALVDERDDGQVLLPTVGAATAPPAPVLGCADDGAVQELPRGRRARRHPRPTPAPSVARLPTIRPRPAWTRNPVVRPVHDGVVAAAGHVRASGGFAGVALQAVAVLVLLGGLGLSVTTAGQSSAGPDAQPSVHDTPPDHRQGAAKPSVPRAELALATPMRSSALD